MFDDYTLWPADATPTPEADTSEADTDDLWVRTAIDLTAFDLAHGRALSERASRREVQVDVPVISEELFDDLLAHGLLRGSFVPPERIQELRDLRPNHFERDRLLRRLKALGVKVIVKPAA